MSSVVIAVQPNGERLRVEEWAYRTWVEHRLNDPDICKILANAIGFYYD